MKKKSLIVLVLAVAMALIMFLTACDLLENFLAGILPCSDCEERPCACYNDLRFRLIKGYESYAIVGMGTVTKKHLTIAPTYLGLPITDIEWSAFGFNDTLVSITLPSTIAIIRPNAFFRSNVLRRIEVDEDNPHFSSQDGVLYNKDKTELVLAPPAGIKGNFAIPDTVTSIGDFAFNGCVGLTSIEIPSGVTSIGNSAFQDCINLVSLELPSGITQIEPYTFDFCESLTSITIPSSVTHIGLSAFYGNTSLTSVIFEENSQLMEIDALAFYRCVNLKDMAIPSGVTRIGSSTFEYCVSLTNIVIPSSVTNIGWSAFEGCTGLTSIMIPSSVTEIGLWAFAGCYSLTSVLFEERGQFSYIHIMSYAFKDCISLTIYISEGDYLDYYQGWNLLNSNGDKVPVVFV
ncbi:MAG: leucine-rich repeat domain-containing protein [Firmicutes bacterium]|nr:leucine-rich repeat domain-containing protein [Bacillota bacterium]